MKIEAWTKPLPDEALRCLELRQWQESENEAFIGLLKKHHYLGCPMCKRRSKTVTGTLHHLSIAYSGIKTSHYCAARHSCSGKNADQNAPPPILSAQIKTTLTPKSLF